MSDARQADRDDGIRASAGVLFAQLSDRRRRLVLPLLALMLAGAGAELLTIGALIPFLTVIAGAGNARAHAYLTPIVDAFGVGSTAGAVYLLTGLFALAAVVAAALRLCLLWASRAYVYGVACELGVAVYDRMLHQPYIFHVRRNSSEIIAAINKVELLSDGLLMPLLQGATALVIASFIVVGLVAIDPAVALTGGIAFIAIYAAVSAMSRVRLKRSSQRIAHAQGARVKAMQEGLGGIRDVLIDRAQPVFLETYAEAEANFRDARIHVGFLSGAPRFIVEALGMVMIAILAIVLVGRPGGLASALPVLGALALGAQRLLPLVQQVYNGWAQTMGNRQVLIDVAALVGRARPVDDNAAVPLRFRSLIRLADVGYRYEAGRAAALNGISLDIPKGARVGIAGRTGSGKSTLMDVLLGLLEPDGGEIHIDGVALDSRTRRAWQHNIAHVPQFIYLADATIAENIAFGVRRSDIDHARVRRAAEKAELAAVVAGLPTGYETRIGERGVQLSGGQRQRVGIARALYKQASVLVFDEATSALDNDTESAVMAAIDGLDRDLTIFIIAHRLTTIEGCDMIVRLEGGRVAAVETSQLPAAAYRS